MQIRLLGLVCALLLTALGALPAYSGPLSEAQRKQDPRLEKPVTLVNPRVYYIGELLEELSRQTGVTLSAGDKDRAAGELVVLRVDNQRLGDVMDALWSLVSYRDATWDWNVLPSGATGKSVGGDTVYQLIRPREAQLLGAKLRQQIQEDFEEEAASVFSNLDKLAEDLKEIQKQNSPGVYMAHQRVHAGREAFAEMFTSDETRLAVLRGKVDLQVPIATLGQKAKDFVESEFKLKQQWNPELSFPKPTHVRVFREQLGGLITPSLIIFTGDERHMEGGCYIGGTDYEKKWHGKVAARWLLDGDATDNPALDRKVDAPRPDTARSTPIPLNPPEMRLWQCAEGASVSFISCLPDSTMNDRGASYGKTVRAALKIMNPLESKWRGDILLVRDPTWFVRETEEERVSWSLVKKLRGAELAAKDGLLPLTVLADVARDFPAKQLHQLSGEFPVLSNVARWHNWFAQMGGKPDLVARLKSPQGVPMQAMRVLSTATLPSNLSADQIRSVRLHITDHPRQGSQPASRSIGFELLGGNGKGLGHAGFYYEGRRQEPTSPDGATSPPVLGTDQGILEILPQPLAPSSQPSTP